MRFDGKKTKQVATSLTIKELSGVTNPAQEGALVTLIKTSGAPEQTIGKVAKARLQLALYTAAEARRRGISEAQTTMALFDEGDEIFRDLYGAGHPPYASTEELEEAAHYEKLYEEIRHGNR